MLGCALVATLASGGCFNAPRDDRDILPEKLSALRLFDGPPARLVPTRDATRYQINSASFGDYAESQLLMKLPRGASIRYAPQGSLEFPLGTVLAQTLSYAGTGGDRRIVETRVLLRRADGWIGVPYVWNDEQTDASLEVIGARIAVRRRAANGEMREQTHVVPNVNDCKRCHRIGDVMTPLATSARQLNVRSSVEGATDQLAGWQRSGLLRGLPDDDELPRLARWNDPASGTVDERARAYLEVNCAHCHNPRGTARNAGLQLGSDVREPISYGVLKTPVAAGRGTGGFSFDILPGAPSSSILLHRVRSVENGVMMPEFGRTQVHAEGAALLSEWIASMPSAADSFAKAGLVGIVTSLTPAELTHWAEESLARGDARRGAEIFQRQELNCAKCHPVAGQGANVGPDLAKLEAGKPPEYVVESILLPDRSIKDGFRAVTLQTEDGLVVTGIQVSDDGREVVLRDPVRGDTRIAKTEIAARSEGGSLMPANLTASLARDELLDLVRYLIELNNQAQAQGGAAH